MALWRTLGKLRLAPCSHCNGTGKNRQDRRGEGQDIPQIIPVRRLQRHRETAMTPKRVIEWLRSPSGEAWSESRITELECHWEDSGVFGELIPEEDDLREGKMARWPDPLTWHALNLQ